MEDFKTLRRGLAYTHAGIYLIPPRWGGEWLVGWQLAEVGPMRTPVII